jgi:SWIM zinc finger
MCGENASVLELRRHLGGVFHVRRKCFSPGAAETSWRGLKSEAPWQKLPPRVHIVVCDANGRLCCDCGDYKRRRIPCRHILAVNRSRVAIEDIPLFYTTGWSSGLIDIPPNRSVDREMRLGVCLRRKEGDADLPSDLPNLIVVGAASEEGVKHVADTAVLSGTNDPSSALQQRSGPSSHPEVEDLQRRTQNARHLVTVLSDFGYQYGYDDDCYGSLLKHIHSWKPPKPRHEVYVPQVRNSSRTKRVGEPRKRKGNSNRTLQVDIQEPATKKTRGESGSSSQTNQQDQQP